LWQKTGSFSLYFSKLKKKKFNEPELQKKKKTLKTNLVKNATKKNVKILSQMKKKETKKRRKCRYKTIHYPPIK